MKWILIIAVALLEAIALWDRPGRLLRPDLLLLVCIYAGLWLSLREAVLLALTAGFLRDLHSLGPLGLHAVALATATVITYAIREELYREHPFTHILLAGVLAWIPPALTVLHVGPGSIPYLIAPAALVALHTAIFAPIFISMPRLALRR